MTVAAEAPLGAPKPPTPANPPTTGRFRLDAVWADCGASTLYLEDRDTALRIANYCSGPESPGPLLAVTVIDKQNPHAMVVLRKGETIS